MTIHIGITGTRQELTEKQSDWYDDSPMYPTPEDKIIAQAAQAGLNIWEFFDWWGTTVALEILEKSQHGWKAE